MNKVAVVVAVAKSNSTQKEMNDTLSAILSKLSPRHYDDDGIPVSGLSVDGNADFYVLSLSGIPHRSLDVKTGLNTVEIQCNVFIGLNPSAPTGVKTALATVADHSAFSTITFDKDKTVDDMNVYLSSFTGQQGYTDQLLLQPGDSFSAGNVNMLRAQFKSIL
jgi:hypothetical protein